MTMSLSLSLSHTHTEYLSFITLLKCNLHIKTFTYLYMTRNKDFSCPLHSIAAQAKLIFFFNTDLSFLGIVYEWNHILHNLLHLPSFP
jgi:hypothetical protein